MSMSQPENARSPVRVVAARAGHFHAHEHFFVDVAFASALPDGAVPAAEFAGPLGPGGPALTFWTTADADIDGRRSRFRLSGIIPREAPAGTYRITFIQINWSEDMPPAWSPVLRNLDQLGGEAVIIVDPPRHLVQPPIPEVVGIGEVVPEA
jgi:hypothetical protein